MIPLDDSTTLSLLFHLNSEPWLNDEAYQRGAPGPVLDGTPAAMGRIDLPAGGPSAIDDLATRRSSCRAYAVAQLPLTTVAALLASAYGVTETITGTDGARLMRRAVPSAGGLFPLDLVVFLRRIDELPDGVYRYDPVGHCLDLLAEGDRFATELSPALYAYPFIEDANGFIAITAVFARVQRKYGPRGYRYALLEAGHVGQNLVLRAVELGLGSLCVGGFVDSALNGSLGLDPRRAGVLYGMGFGRASAGIHSEPAAHDYG